MARRLLWKPWQCALMLLVSLALRLCVAEQALLLRLDTRTGGALHVSWVIHPSWLENDAASSVESYTVSLNNTVVGTVPASTTSFALYGLAPVTTYAVNVTGTITGSSTASLTSNELVAATLPPTNPIAPPVPEVIGVGGGFLHVRVTLPVDTGGAPITIILLSVLSQVDSSVSITLSTVASDLEFTVYGLTAKSMYRVRTYVLNSAGLYSPQSASLYTDTAAVRNPGPCPPPTVLNTTGGSIGLQLNPPIDDGGARIKGYIVYMAVNGSAIFEEAASTILSAEINQVEIQRLPGLPVQTLRPLTRYDLYAVAVIDMDICVSQTLSLTGADTVTVYTAEASLPEAPPPPYFLSATGSHATIQLLMPGNMRGSALMGFSVMVNGSLHSSVNSTDELAFEIISLSARSNYTVQVAIITDVGTSAWSSEALITTLSATSPQPPTNVVVTDVTPSQALVQWTAPTDNGGVDITDYALNLVSSLGSTRLATANASTRFWLTNLVAQTVYTVKVSAVNANQRESSSTKLTGATFQTLPPTIPSAPRGVRVVDKSGGMLEIAWGVPAASGGFAYAGLVYNVSLFEVAPCFESSNTSACSGCNAIRAASNQYQLAVSGEVCKQPESQSCLDGSSNCCVSSTGTLCQQTLGVTRHRVVAGGKTSVALFGLNHTTTYYVGVQAINAVGRSSFSSIAELTTSGPTPPGYSTQMGLVNRTGGSVLLSWSQPLDAGGSSIIGYNVYRDYKLLTPRPVLPPFQDCGGGLVADTQYLYGIAAVNVSAMEGAVATIPVRTGWLSLPQQIRSLKLANRTTTWINVTIDVGCDTGGSTGLSYQYILRQDGIAVTSGVIPCCSLLLAGLQPDQAYEVSVMVPNEVGSLAWYNETFSTSSGVPQAPTMQLIRANSFSLDLAPSQVVDYEIIAYDVQVIHGSELFYSTTMTCEAIATPGQRSCPRSFRLDGLSPSTVYGVTVRAVGPSGSSQPTSQTFVTSNEGAGAFEFTAAEYSVIRGGTRTLVVNRVNGTAGAVGFFVDVTQPDTVVLRCQCTNGQGCDCGLFPGSSGELSSPASFEFLDGQESQPLRLSTSEDDQSATDSISALFVISADTDKLGAVTQALLHVVPSTKAGRVSFISANSEVSETAQFVQVNMVRVNGSSGVLPVVMETFDITARSGKDYIPVAQKIFFGDRQTTAAVWIQIVDNGFFSGSRVFGVRLRDATGTGTASPNPVSTKRITVVDDDDPTHLLPPTPLNVQQVVMTGGEIQVVWQPGNSSLASPSGYIVQVSTSQGGSPLTGVYRAADPVFVLSGLTPATSYSVQVAAWNEYGQGEFTTTLFAHTSAPTPPSHPQDLVASLVGSSSIELSWNPPRDTGGSVLSGYELWKHGTDGMLQLLEKVAASTTSYVIQDLFASTEYTFLVSASTTAFPSAMGSNATITVATQDGSSPTKPPTPVLLRQPTAGTLSFLIQDPSDIGGSLIFDYSLYLRRVSDTGVVTYPFTIACSSESPWASGALSRSCTVYKLIKNTAYEAYVVLFNVIGPSPESDRVIVRTSPNLELPSSPVDFRASQITAGMIMLVWERPLDLGGAEEALGYTVFQKMDFFSDEYFVVYDGRDSTARQVVIKPLTRSTAYAFAVVAQNLASYCVNLDAQKMSDFLIVTTLAYSPLSPPQSITLQSATGGSLRLGWSAPDDLAGVPLHGYIVELVIGENATDTQVLTPETIGAPYFTHFGLTESTQYKYAVTAVNQDGPGERSEFVTFSTTVGTMPRFVLDLRPVETLGGRIILTWDPPEDNGGHPIQFYQVVRLDRPNVKYNVTTTSFTDVYGLSALSQYSYYVQAHNGLYIGPAQYIGVATGEPSVSAAPVLNDVLAYGGKLVVSWSPDADTGGVPVIEYVLSLTDSNGTIPVASVRGSNTTQLFSGLTAKTEYRLSIAAVNLVGEGAALLTSLFTAEVDLPSPPPAPAATYILGGTISLEVAKPAYNGGENVSLLLHNGSVVVHDFGLDGSATIVTGLIAMTQYKFHVIAVNSRGQVASPELIVSTGEVSAPSEVVSVQLAVASFDRLSITWTPVIDNGGDTELQYEVSSFKCTDTGDALSAVTTTRTKLLTSVLLGLDHSSFYCVAIQAVTSTGLFGTASSVAQFATEPPISGQVTAQLPEYPIQEDQAVASVPLVRIDGSYGDIEYYYETIDESAIAGLNYEAITGTFIMTSGTKTGSIAIPLINDIAFAPNVSFLVKVRDVATDLMTQTRVFLLDDGDAGFISFTTPTSTSLENTGMIMLPFARNGGTSPAVEVELYIKEVHGALATRFTFAQTHVTFEEGATVKYLQFIVQDDVEFQYWPDSVAISFNIVSGGAWVGNFPTMNITVLNDGDVSPPKHVTGLTRFAATGGSMAVQWSSPLDRGGANVELAYRVVFAVDGVPIVETVETSTSTVVYGLTASTMYQVTVQAVNSAGEGPVGNPALLSTTQATPPSAPLAVSVVAASSSSLTITWNPPLDTGGSPIDGYNIFQVLASGALSQFTSVSCVLPTTCRISGLLALTTYQVQVGAVTALSSNDGELSPFELFHTSTPDVPDPPPLASVVWVSAGAMTIKMFNPLNVGGSGIEEYRLFMRGPLDEDFVQMYQGTASSTTLYRLERRSVYAIKYQVTNTVGASPFGDVLEYSTQERSLASAPLQLSVFSITGGAIGLRWAEPLDIGGRAITGYTVIVKTPWTALTGATDIIGYDGRNSPQTEGVVFGLNASSPYTFYVIAYTEVSNCFSPSELEPSASLQKNTSTATLPSTAPTLVLVSFTGGLIELLWNPPIDTGGVPIAFYTLLLLTPTGSIPLVVSSGTEPRTFKHTDLIESTVYTYAIRANTSVGESPLSQPLVAKTLVATAPSAPTNVKQLDYVTGGAIEIGWDRPLDTGGQPLRGYWIYRNGMTIAQNVEAFRRSYIDSNNLQASTVYEYTVRAFSLSSMGSEMSMSLAARTSSVTRPLKARLVGSLVGASFITATWSADSDSGGVPIQFFDAKLIRSASNTVVGSSTGLGTSFEFTGLTASTTYSLVIVAHNQIGPSEPMTVNLMTAAGVLPDPPVAPIALFVFGGNVTLSMALPVKTGGSTIVELRVYEAKLGFIGAVLDPADKVPIRYTVFSLLKTTTYDFSVSAVNVVGEGNRSAVTTVRTGPANAPGPIATAPTVGTVTGTTISVSWIAPLDTGGEATVTYEVRFVEASGVTTTFTSITRQLLASALKFDTGYSISVRVSSSVGKSAWSAATTAKTLPDSAGQFNMATSTVEVAEGAGQVVLTVLRTNGASGTVTVGFSTASTALLFNLGATVGKDYALSIGSTRTTGTITFNPQQTSATITIFILNDGEYEHPDEKISVALTSATLSGTSSIIPPSLGSSTSCSVTILEDGDAGILSFTASVYAVREDGVFLLLPIVREGGTSGRLVIGFAAADRTTTVDRDYRRVILPVVIENGLTTGIARVSIINDRIYEFPDESFMIQMILLSGDAIVKRATTMGLILDDGDVSDPATPPPPVVLQTTGGSVSLRLGLPAHNGSATGPLTSFIVRIRTPLSVSSLFDATIPAALSATIGNLTALTTYEVSVAAKNSAGQSPFGTWTWFTTGPPSLPGPVTTLSMVDRTGGSIQLKWQTPDDTGGVPITKYRVYEVTPTGALMLALERLEPVDKLTIAGLRSNSSYQFIVQAGSSVPVPEFAHGWGALAAATTFSTTNATLPAPTVVEKGAPSFATGGAFMISFAAPLDTGGEPLLGFHIYTRNASTPFTLTTRVLQPELRSARVEDRYAASWYEVFVLAVNRLDGVALSGQFTCAPGATALTTSQDLSRRVASGSVVRIRTSTFLIGDMALATKGTLPLVVPHTGAAFSKQPASLLGVAQHFANISTTAATIPHVPPSAELLNTTGGAIAFSIESPGDTGGVPIEDFSVFVDGVEPGPSTIRKRWLQVTHLKKTLVMHVASLQPQTLYEVTAIAVNSISLCDFSKKSTSMPVTFETTAVTRPGLTEVVSQSVTGGGMTLSLLDPFDNGGSNITRYQLYMSADTTVGDWNLVFVGVPNENEEQGSTATIAGLQPMTKYLFKLSVSNGVYESDNSSAVAIWTSTISSPGQCGAPTQAAATGGMIAIEWPEPLDDGGAKVIDYLVRLETTDGKLVASAAEVVKRTHSFYGLIESTAYVASVRARNKKGVGPKGVGATVFTAEGTPPNGRIQVDVFSSTGGAAIIRFNPPQDFGGTPQEDMTYNVIVDNTVLMTLNYDDLEGMSSGGGSTGRRLTSSAASGIVVGGLDPLALYNIQVQAVNNFATGNVSDVSLAATTAPTLPSAPRDLATTSVSGGLIGLTWNTPADTGGLPLVGYSVYMSTTASGPFTLRCQDTISECRVVSLAARTTYWFYVIATNALGDSPADSTISVTTTAVMAPSNPSKVQVLSVSHDSIECSWVPPINTGGAPITSYTVTVADTAAGTLLSPITVTSPSVQITGLSSSTKYDVAVSATNQLLLSSAQSTSRSVMTASGVNTPADVMAPCVSAYAVGLMWFAYPGATHYRLYQNGTMIYTGASTQFTVEAPTVDSDSFYEYSLEAEVNSVWAGSLSSPVVVHTLPATQNLSSTEAQCTGEFGYLHTKDYMPDANHSWVVQPTTVYSTMTLEFYSFDLECDHDVLEIVQFNDGTPIWSGGCRRAGSFLIQVKTGVRVRFLSDASVQKTGFSLLYEIDRDPADFDNTRIPAPVDANNAVCSNHGNARQRGLCKCSVGFTGEACNNHMVCCTDPKRCWHPVCEVDPSRVITVSDEFGDDVNGTGEMMDTTEEGKASKAVQTLSKALSISSDGDMIFLYPGTYKGPQNRALQVVSRQSIAIQSLKSYAWTTLDCEGQSRAFSVTRSNLTIEGLTVRDGTIAFTGGDGGAVWVSESTVKLSNVLITGGLAARYGGAVALVQSKLFMSGTSIERSNATVAGGGLYVSDSQITMDMSNVTTCGAGAAGGILVDGTTSEIVGLSNALITSCTAGSDAGGGLSVRGHVSMKRLVITENEALRGGGFGVADASRLVLDECAITKNKAVTDGGGLAVLGSADIISSGSCIDENVAGAAGGGIFVEGEVVNLHLGSPVESTLRQNSADRGAGVDVVDSILSLSGTTISNGVAKTSGGGIHLFNTTSTIANVYLSSNTALRGGGLTVEKARVEFTGTTVIEANNASSHGGGIYVSNSDMEGAVLVKRNRANQRGGGFFGSGTLSIKHMSIRRCTADEGGGGYLNGAKLSTENVTITETTATSNGGGLLMMGTSLDAKTSQIRGGEAVLGGGVYAYNGCSLGGELHIAESTAVEDGGALYAKGRIHLQSLTILSSQAKRGAGVFISNADATIEHVNVSSCFASIEGGGGRIDSSAVRIEHTTFTKHRSDGSGGGLVLADSRLLHLNLTVHENTALLGGGVVMMNTSFLSDTAMDETVSSILDNRALQHGGNVVMEGRCSINSTLIAGGDAKLSGGGVLMRGSKASVSYCTVERNYAGQAGGGLRIQDQSECELVNVAISDNEAAVNGGGVSTSQSVIKHEELVLIRNRAFYGGGFWIGGVGDVLPRVLMASSTVNFSVAAHPLLTVKGSGAALFIAPASEVRVAGLLISYSDAAKGGVFVDHASLELNDCQFHSNVATDGGALFVSAKSTVRLTNSELLANRATSSGGGVRVLASGDDPSTIEIEDCLFTKNTAESIGAAVAMSYGTLITRFTNLTDNAVTKKNGQGGAIAAITKATLNITDCVFTGNRIDAVPSKGGSLFAASDSDAWLERVTFQATQTTKLSDDGGSIFVSGATSFISLVDCEITRGVAEFGGAVYISDATATLLRTKILAPRASDSGGSLYIASANVDLIDSSIFGSRAFYDGGGVYVRGKSTVNIRSSSISSSGVRDGGAGVFIAPGGGAFVNVSNTKMTMNTNQGLGSAIFIGRKNSLVMADCDIYENGVLGATITEGGTLHAVDAQISIRNSTFVGNAAMRGAAIELSRDSSMTMTDCELTNNTASDRGGAVYLAVRAALTIKDSRIQGNAAAAGGGIYALGSAAVTLQRVEMTSNRAASFGRAVTVVGRAALTSSNSRFELNTAYTGGAFSATENASLVLTTNEFHNNEARDFGGAIYLDTLLPTASNAIKFQVLHGSNNAARTGADLYWVYHQWFTLTCGLCVSTSSSTGKWQIASSPSMISAGWWPTLVTSGVSLGITKPKWTRPDERSAGTGLSESGTGSSTRRLNQLGLSSLSSSSSASSASSSGASSAAPGGISEADLEAIIADPSLTSPYESQVWPTLVVRDFYGVIAAHDNATTCSVSKNPTEADKFEFYPANPIAVERGYVTLADAQILAISRLTPFDVRVTCTLADDVVRELALSIQVETCNPGFENTDGRCVPCKKGTYSMDGVKCHLCPLGATCERLDETNTVVGVSLPTRSEGYFLYESRETYKSSFCDDPSSWDDEDPCRDMDPSMNMTFRLQNCSKAETFEKFWPRKRVFACLSSMEYYTCDTRDACIQENATVVSLARSVEELSELTQCDAGYDSVTCSTCQNGYYKVSNGTCRVCSDPNDPAVERMTRLIAMIPIGMFGVALVLVWYYFSNAFEEEIMKQANAARKFQIYDPRSRPRSIIQVATAHVKELASTLATRVREKITIMRRPPTLFNIHPPVVMFPAFRAEKFKIMLGFFQIFGGFKKLYEIPWPDEMSRLMDLFSIADFSLVDTTGIECFIHKDYFSNYRLSLIAMLVLLFATSLLLSWGIIRYRVKLARLPRHCVKCGLPVFEMLRREPKTLVRRTTMVSMLRLERKQQEERIRRRSFATCATAKVMTNVESWFSRSRDWWNQTRLGKAIQRFILFTRLPASSSEHYPRCPTTQQITSGVQGMVVPSNLRLWRARIRLRLNYQSFQNKCIKLFFWILLLFYPELSQRVIGMFYCDELGSSHYMTRDKSQLCYQGVWLYYLPLTLFLIFVWVVGVPLLFWMIIFVKRNTGVDDKILLLADVRHTQLKNRLLDEMRQNLIDRGVHVDESHVKAFERDMLTEFLRNKKLNEPSMIAQVGFIYHSYRTHFWWFEVWDLGRKLCLNCIIGLLAKTGANRIIAGLIVFLIYLSIMLFYQPYKDASDSALAGLTQIQLFVTLFCGLMLKMGAMHLPDTVIALLTYVAFVSNAFTITYAVISIIYEKVDAMRKAKRRAGEEYRRAIQSHVRKLWHKAYGYASTEVYLLDSSIRSMPMHVILELARRDREAQKLQELETQLVRSFPVDQEMYEDQVGQVLDEDQSTPLETTRVGFGFTTAEESANHDEEGTVDDEKLASTDPALDADAEPAEPDHHEERDRTTTDIDQAVHQSEEVTL